MAVHQPGDTIVWLKEMRLYLYPLPWWERVIRPFRFLVELAATFSPWLILALPVLVPAWRRSLPAPVLRRGREDQDLIRALVWYMAGFSSLLFFWPESETRYAMPAVPAMALAVGLAGARLGRVRWWRTLLLVSLAGLSVYQLFLNLVHLPLNQDKYTASRRAGQELAAILDREPGPVQIIAREDQHNVLFYLGRPIRELESHRADLLRSPGWLIVTPRCYQDVAQYRAARTDRLVAQVESRKGRSLLVVRLGPD